LSLIDWQTGPSILRGDRHPSSGTRRAGLLDHENEGNKIFRNVGEHLTVDMT